MTADFGGTLPMRSFRESPLVDGDKVICTPGGDNTALVALDKLTGKTIWKTAIIGKPSSCLLLSDCHRFRRATQYVQMTTRALVGVAATMASYSWKYEKPANNMGINCSTPLFHGLKGVCFASAYGSGVG